MYTKMCRKRKQRLGLVLTTALVLAIPALINFLIFKLANKKTGIKIREFYYNWRYGKIRYITLGKGEPLLLVHGIGAGVSLYEWENNIMELSKHYKVYAFDLLGFGYSDKPDISYSSYLYISLINDFIEDVIGTKTNIIASSSSAAYAVFAYSFKPELYKKMLLISPTGVGTGSNQPRNKDLWLKWLIESPLIGTTIYTILSSRFYMKWFLAKKCYSKDAVITRKEVSKYYNPAHFGGVHAKYPIAAFMSNMLNVNIESKLSGIKIPIHVIWGLDNSLNPVANLDLISKINPQIETTVFEDTRLLPHSENPRAFLKICKGFFK